MKKADSKSHMLVRPPFGQQAYPLESAFRI